jgi:phosphate transport system protein
MTHYEQRLEQDLQAIRSAVDSLGKGVEEALERAVRAFLTRDEKLAYETILRDQILNRKVRDLDRACHHFVARHLPSAGHLRFISSVLRLAIALERIGDYSVTICRESVQMSQLPPAPVVRDLELLAEEARRALRQSLQAFSTLNPELARGTHAMVAVSSAAYDKAFADLLEEGRSAQVKVRELFSMLVIFNRLGRVCDQAKNICEEAIFAATGQTKEPRHFKILFLEPPGSWIARMAVAIGRKAFPEGASFSAATLEPAVPVDPKVVEFMDLKGHSLPGIETHRLSETAPADIDLLVALGGVRREDLPAIPYHVVFQSWPVQLGGTDPESLERVYRDLAVRLRDLMEVLRGSA